MNEQLQMTELDLAQQVEEIKSSDTFLDLLKKTSEFKLTIQSIRIKTDEDEVRALDSVAALRKTSRDAESMRKSAIAWPWKFCQTINGLFKGLMSELDGYDVTITTRVSQYRIKKKAEAAKQQAATQKIMDRAVKHAEKAGVHISNLPVEIPLIEPAKTVRTENATATMRTVWDFEITNKLAFIRAVAEGQEKSEALEINSKYVRGLINAGIRELPGLRIFQQESLSMRFK